jgi:hypothetical protein
MVLRIRDSVFWDETLYSLAESYQRFASSINYALKIERESSSETSVIL